MGLADESLSGLATAEPSPALRVRIRETVARETRPVSLRWRFAWTGAAAAVLLLAALGAWRVPDKPPLAAQAPGASEPQPPRLVGDLARVAAEGDGRRDDGRRTVAESTPARLRRSDGGGRRAEAPEAGTDVEVLVPPDEQERLLGLVRFVHREGLQPPMLGMSGSPSPELADLAPITIRPLEIVPLDPVQESES
jgi:hypothetical protein